MRRGLAALLCVCSWAYLDLPVLREFDHVMEPFLFMICAAVSAIILQSGSWYKGLSRSEAVLYFLFGLFVIRSAYSAPAASLLFPGALVALLFYHACRHFLLNTDPERLSPFLVNVFAVLIGGQLLYFIFYMLLMQGDAKQISSPNSSIYAEALAMQLVFFAGSLAGKKKQFFHYILIASGAVLLLALNSRASWLAVMLCIFVHFIQRLSATRRRIVIITGAIALVFIFFFLIGYKRDSSEGRALIYKVSGQMLRDHYFAGIGPGQFALRYNVAQAAYFSNHDINSTEALRAGNTVYVFNEWLQCWMEEGLLCFVLLLIYTFRLLRYGFRSSEPIVKAASHGLLCTIVTAQFSYPLHFLPVLLQTLLCMAIIETAKLRQTVVIISRSLFLYLLLIVAASFTIFCFYQQLNNRVLAKKAFLLSAGGQKKAALHIYQQLETDRYTTGRTLYEYAKTLWDVADTIRANSMIRKAKRKGMDADLLLLSARIHHATGDDKQAEADHLAAIYMFPSRMRSRFACFRFYQERRDTGSARDWARMILEQPVADSSRPYIIKVRQAIRVFLAENGQKRSKMP